MASDQQNSKPVPSTASGARQSRPKNLSTRTSSTQEAVGRTQNRNSPMPASHTTAAQDSALSTASTPANMRRKPRKLNKQPTSESTQNVAKITPATAESADTASNAELEALKSRVRGLEAKVEQLYGSTEMRAGRSPRRRGKGRKASSTQLPTTSNASDFSTTKAQESGGGEENEMDEDLVKLEGELKVARQDLEAYRPRLPRSETQDSEETVEIPRNEERVEETGKGINKRHVTLSGSYRIPLPTNVSMDDVKTIQNGVSAAHNVARSFLEQRRAAASARGSQNQANSPSSRSAKTTASPKAVSSSMEIAVANDGEGGKQSWGEWIGGYSMAISRAVTNMEHQAFMESQTVDDNTATGRTAKTATKPARTSTPLASKGKKNTGAKRPVAKTKLSSEQVQGLMG